MTAASLLVALLASAPCAGLPHRLPEDTFKVASEGGRWCCILASEKHAKLARELNVQLSRATSATFPIHPQPHANTAYIVLGTADEHPDVAKQERLAEMGPEGFAVRSEERRLWLVANTPLGLQHAVYRLLHHIGYRWYFPDSFWHVTPLKPDLTVTLRVREKPAFGYRRIWYGWGPRTPKLKQDYEMWLRANRQLGHFRVDCGHAWERHIPRGEFAKHPEWFALVKGKRKPTQLCVTNPELQREFVRRVVEACRKHGESKMISVEPNDGGGYCECDGCKKLGSASDGVFHLASLTARAVRKEFPDRWVGLYAYAGHSEPPMAPIASGVYVQVTTGFRYTKLTFDEQVAAFRKRGAKLGVYDYFSVYPWDKDMPGAAKGGRVYQLADALRHYHKLGLSTYDAESSCNWGPNGLGYWMASKLMWQPSLSADALVDDFCTRAFGKAAQPMRRLYDRWATGERFSPRGLKLALLDLKRAYEQESDAAVRARLDRVA
ncbi:DUF4838 domain-containing protein, partial [bacterium]|nr:DUF4838 domain-containing protein [bacterium]